MTSRDLDGVWTVLSTAPPESGIAVAPEGTAVVAGDVLIGVDRDGRRHLLIPLLPGEAARTDTRGRGVHISRINHQNTAYLTVYCLLPNLHQVFTQFCRELIVTVEDAHSPAKEAAAALDRWRALFSDAERGDLLSDEALLGLIGELLVVERLLAVGAPPDLSYWVGPFSGIHDFRSRSFAIEVKATLVREGRIVPISSVDQLQEPSGAVLFLVQTRLLSDPAGVSLPELVARIVDAGAQQAQMDRRLNELGILPGDLSRYLERKFKIAESRVYDVASEAFPRLLRSSFSGNDIPPGTLRISYSIDLTNEPPHALADDAVDTALVAFATEASNAMDS